MSIKKAQILLITTFSLLLGVTVLYISLSPIISSLKSLRETTDSYQAMSNAEAGLEIEFLHQFTNEDILDGDKDGNRSRSNNINDNKCKKDEDIYGGNPKPDNRRSKGCSLGRSNFDLEISTTTREIGGKNFIIIKIGSLGKEKTFERTLFFDAPGAIVSPSSP